MADDWRSPSKRQAVIQKLEEALGNLGNPSTSRQNPTEMEKALFEKSKSKDEYMSYFHNIILMLSRQKQQAQMMSGARPNPPMMGMGGQPPMGINQPAPGYQPNYNQFPPNNNMMLSNQVPSNPGYGGPQLPQQPPQYHPGGMYPQGQGGNQNPGMHMPPGTRFAGNMNMSQGYVPQNRQNYSGHNMGMVNNTGGYSGGGMYNQPVHPGGQGPGPMPHGNMMRPVMRQPGMIGQRPGLQVQQMQQPQAPFMNEGGVGGQSVQSVPNPSYPSSIRPSSGPVYSSGSMTSAGNQVPMPPGVSATQHPVAPGAPPPSSINNPPTPHAPSLQGPVPSPAPPTPLYPASPATSGVGSPATQPIMTPEENEAYIRKLGELQKYIPLLSKWISRVSTDERKGDQYIKLKSLFNLLRDSNRRVPLTTLKKCEIALERMLMKENSDSSHHPKNPSLPPSSSSSSSSSSVAPSDPTVPEPKFSNPPQSQSLLDFKMVLSPPATCTNLMDTIQPHPFPTERLPAAKQFYVTEDGKLPPSLTKEIAYLKQFDIKVVPSEDNNKFNKSTTIQCLLMDENIPVVPALDITLPSTYPQHAPRCDLSHYLNSSSPFLVEVGNLLSEKLSKKSSTYSLSALLDYWEIAILRAMAKELLTQEE